MLRAAARRAAQLRGCTRACSGTAPGHPAAWNPFLRPAAEDPPPAQAAETGGHASSALLDLACPDTLLSPFSPSLALSQFCCSAGPQTGDGVMRDFLLGKERAPLQPPARPTRPDCAFVAFQGLAWELKARCAGPRSGRACFRAAAAARPLRAAPRARSRRPRADRRAAGASQDARRTAGRSRRGCARARRACAHCCAPAPTRSSATSCRRCRRCRRMGRARPAGASAATSRRPSCAWRAPRLGRA